MLTNLPNILTMARVVMIPVIMVVFYLPYEWSYLTCAIIFALAGVTDWFDGYLARRWNQSTPFGAFLDPVADKLMVSVSLMMLIEMHHSIWLTLPAVVIVFREILISALREWMAEMGKRGNVAVSHIGKIKTACQMVSIIMLLAAPPHTHISIAGHVLLYIAAILTIWSMVVYLQAAWPELMGKA